MRKDKKNQKEVKKLKLAVSQYPNTTKIANTSPSWRRMVNIAEQSMKQEKYNIEDVKKSLSELRKNY